MSTSGARIDPSRAMRIDREPIMGAAISADDAVEIQQLLHRVASTADLALDLVDYEELLTVDVVFVFDAVPSIGLEAVTYTGRAAAMEGVRSRRAAGVQGPGSGTMHIVNDVVVTPESADRASASAAWQYLITGASGPQIAAFGSYRNRVRRTAGRWLLERREVTVLSGQGDRSRPGIPDREQITRTIATYARLADERRAAEMAALFTVDGRLELFRPRSSEPAEVAEGRAQLERAFLVLARFPVTTHFLGQSIVDVDGDTATAQTYGMSHHISGDTPDDRRRVTLADRYVDTLRRVDGVWLFSARR